MKKFLCLQELPPTEPAAAAAEEVVAAETQEEAPAEGGLVDIASILGAPTVTVVRSSL
jgi:predicted secreted protein